MVRKAAHIGREGLLIYCVKNPECETLNDKFKSYVVLAIAQTVFDRIAFKTEISLIKTAISRFLYLVSVSETINFMTNIVDRILIQKTRSN